MPPEGERVRAIKYVGRLSPMSAPPLPDCNGVVHWPPVVEDVKARLPRPKSMRSRKLMRSGSASASRGGMSMEIKRAFTTSTTPHSRDMRWQKHRPAGGELRCNELHLSSVVSVVYMTGNKPADTPYRVRIALARSVRTGTAQPLCDHICIVDVSRVGKYMGQCSQEEMDAIDNAPPDDDGPKRREVQGAGRKAAPQPCKAPQPAPYTVPGKAIALVIAETEKGHLQDAL